MPHFNQKGPNGEGPMTGRRMGKCTQYGTKLPKNSAESNSDGKTTETNEIQFQQGFLHHRRRKNLGRF